MAGLHVPLSTLHVPPCDCPRMTRGQVGSLRLTCTTLAFATSRRFIPAHSNCVQNKRFYRLLSGLEASKANCIKCAFGLTLYKTFRRHGLQLLAGLIQQG